MYFSSAVTWCMQIHKKLLGFLEYKLIYSVISEHVRRICVLNQPMRVFCINNFFSWKKSHLPLPLFCRRGATTPKQFYKDLEIIAASV